MSLLFRQLFDSESSTYTYILADSATREAIMIDPVKEKAARDLQLIRELNLKLLYILETHVHADHITGADEIRKNTNAQCVVGKATQVQGANLLLNDGDALKFGHHTVRALSTPGHTDGCMCYFVADRVFTGDTLMIRLVGRTDFQAGSPEKMYDSITQKLFTLPESTLLFPGHDYKGMTCSSIGEEKLHNQRIGGGRSKADFVTIMKNLKLDPPKRISVAVPANMQCGRVSPVEFTSKKKNADGIWEISVQETLKNIERVHLIDVRTREEYYGELGHIRTARLSVLDDTLLKDLQSLPKDEVYVFVCRSGRRSSLATKQAELMGFTQVYNMGGGMLQWEALGFDADKTSPGSSTPPSGRCSL